MTEAARPSLARRYRQERLLVLAGKALDRRRPALPPPACSATSRSNGWRALLRAEIQLPVHFDPAVIGAAGERDALAYARLAKQAARADLAPAAGRKERKGGPAAAELRRGAAAAGRGRGRSGPRGADRRGLAAGGLAGRAASEGLRGPAGLGGPGAEPLGAAGRPARPAGRRRADCAALQRPLLHRGRFPRIRRPPASAAR